MGKLECLLKRSKKIDGKDIGAILGLDKYRNITRVYEEKTNDIENSQRAVEAIYWINTLEEVVSREFMLRTRKKIRKNNINSIDKDYEFMSSNVNRKIIGENSILDCKVINGLDEIDIYNKEFSKKYMLQAQHDMKVKKADKCYIAVLINGEKFILQEVKRDEGLISKIVKVEEKFWNNYIEKKIEPKKPLSLDKLD
jgi:putative phage-type endonuclease